MNIFIAGGSGAIGRSLVPMLVKAGHKVLALTRSSERASSLESMGAIPVIGNVFEKDKLTNILVDAKPDVVIHQLTAFGSQDGDPLGETIRIRTEGTRNLVEASVAANVKRLITQSISFICTPFAENITNEETPLYLEAPDTIRPLAEAVAEMERRTLGEKNMEGVVLRYGWFYGPGTNYDPKDVIPRAVRKGKARIIGGGAGTFSFIHIDDAARATMKALTNAKPGIYNIVDDDPAKQSVWLPYIAELLNAPAPGHMDEDPARDLFGGVYVYTMTDQRGASNAKAKRDLHWEPRIKSWRDGFKTLYVGS